MRERRHVWPVPIGIVIAVFGGGAVLASAWMIVGWLIMSRVLPAMAEVNAASVPIEKFAVSQYVLGAIGMVIAVLAIVAGIGLARRRPWSPRVVVVWSLLKVLYGIVASGVASAMQADTMSSGIAAAGGAGGTPFNDTFLLAMAIVTFIMYALWYSALPIFVLIWMRRPSVRRETARWTNASASVGE